MPKEKSIRQQVAEYFGLDQQTIMAIGWKALLLQYLDHTGHQVTTCDDANGAGYTGDLEADIKNVPKMKK